MTSGISFVFLAGCVLLVAGGPILTDDLWWHLAMGEVYLTEGPWPAGDPLLHTAHEDAPVQHEWLFGVGVHGLERLVGLTGLRVAHALTAGGILLLALSLCRRRSGSWAMAAFGASAFAVLSWWRLFQFRPDLFSIPAAMLVYLLLLERGDVPSWRRVGAFLALSLVWANVHSLFAIGPLLLLAALAGVAARAVLRTRVPGGSTGGDAALARHIGAALGLSLLVTLLNPRGAAQHLTFFTSSTATGIWRVHDEWTPFDPFSFDYTTLAIDRLAWITADLLLVAFLSAALFALVRFLRRPDASTLYGCDPVLAALAAASCVAAAVSIRFLWMGIFPLLFVLHVLRTAVPAAHAGRVRLALGAASIALAIAFPLATSWPSARAQAPADPGAWLTTPFVRAKYHVEGVRFLRDAGLEGNLFNKYPMGGFLGYWLSPKLRTFVDSRTEHYPPEVLDDYSAVNLLRGVGEGESFLDVLARREVDLFFGTGPPTGAAHDAGLHTAEHLRGVPGWLLVSRSVHHALYLRSDERNRENLARVASYYEREGVPFDPAVGLDVARVVTERPEWAIEHEMVPPDWLALEEARRSGDPAASDEVARTWSLLGNYEAALDIDARLVEERPEAPSPKLRRIYGLLRTGRPDEARREAGALRATAPDLPAAQRAQRAVEGYSRAQARAARSAAEGPQTAPENQLLRFPLLGPEGQVWLRASFHRTTLP